LLSVANVSYDEVCDHVEILFCACQRTGNKSDHRQTQLKDNYIVMGFDQYHDASFCNIPKIHPSKSLAENVFQNLFRR